MSFSYNYNLAWRFFLRTHPREAKLAHMKMNKMIYRCTKTLTFMTDPVTEYDLELLKEDRDADYAPGPFLDDSESGGGIHCRKHKGHWQKRRRQIAGNVNTKWRRKLAKKAGWMH